jgi:hypothetical protein
MYGSTTSSDPTKILSASLRYLSPIISTIQCSPSNTRIFKNYQRMICLQYNEGSPDEPTSDAPNYNISIGQKGFSYGSVFANIGTGGAGHESIDSPVSYSITNNSSAYGVLVPFFDNRSLDAIHKVFVRFYNIRHQIIDEFSIAHLLE